MYSFLNVFFFAFHSLVIVFNLFGWIWKKTRAANLAVLMLTAFSWFVLGLWYGIGYCFCTDWHWQVRRALGYHDAYGSYVRFLLEEITSLEVSGEFADWLAGICFAAALAVSVALNTRDWRRQRLKKPDRQT